jgi:hypothetical protein
MTREAYDKWVPVATALTAVRNSLSTPMHVMLDEAAELAAFVRAHRQPSTDQAGDAQVPGLSQAGGQLRLEIADELIRVCAQLVFARQQRHDAHCAADTGAAKAFRREQRVLRGVNRERQRLAGVSRVERNEKWRLK